VAGTRQFFGQFLVSQEIVSSDALEEAVRYQKECNLPLGALALSKAYLTEGQVQHVHGLQRRTDRFFGELAVERGFLTPGQLDELLKDQAEARVLIGEALLAKGHLTRDRLNEALLEYHASQSTSEEALRETIDEHPQARLLDLSQQLTERMLLRLAGMLTKPLEVLADTRPEPLEHWITMQVEGDRNFTYALTLDSPQLLAVAQGLLREVDGVEAPTEVDELALDAGREFANIVVGHICTHLSRTDREQTMPKPPRSGAPEPVGDGERWAGVRMLLPDGELAMGLLFA
jgi:hypothetical protein